MPAALEFEWDEKKNLINMEKHGIAFRIAIKVFDDKCFIYQSSRKTARGIEMRQVAVGGIAGNITAVIYTERHEKIRIISARPARKKEKIAYRALQHRQSSRTH